eukprot:TRINITY_DN6358_c0_g1_i9.p5 TRINITY_DN6358_c0_g1~~TRINITY_DN6358_c0_g1_i9.p5  ORF type:complete len:124 (+),score=5.92 TRINITY_DN6358_c0_g1_i9:251-622(+)
MPTCLKIQTLQFYYQLFPQQQNRQTKPKSIYIKNIPHNAYPITTKKSKLNLFVICAIQLQYRKDTPTRETTEAEILYQTIGVCFHVYAPIALQKTEIFCAPLKRQGQQEVQERSLDFWPKNVA